MISVRREGCALIISAAWIGVRSRGSIVYDGSGGSAALGLTSSALGSAGLGPDVVTIG